MKMHWCTARINLAGQNYTIVVLDETQPVSWPEVQVLQALHGEDNLMDIKPISVADVSVRREKDRLKAKYGKIVEQVFPGASPRMETLMPGESEDQRAVDAEGETIDADEGPAEPPSGPAVFKPGRPRPAAGA